MNLRPMLAATLEDLKQVRFPIVVSPKLDGIRCLIHNGVAVSRNLKPIRNLMVQQALRTLPNGLDGELIVGSPTEGHVIGRTTSGVMSVDGSPDFTYHVFDQFAEELVPFIDRWNSTLSIDHPRVRSVPHHIVDTLLDLITIEQQFINEGYEGIMLRYPTGRYKFGRSTLNEALLMKYKRFVDGEAIVTSILEGVSNMNEAELDALGYTTRSMHQGNMRPSGKVGTIVATDLASGVSLQIAPGRLTHAERKYYLQNPDQLIGKVIKYKAFDYGILDVPRFCTYQALRDQNDRSPGL